MNTYRLTDEDVTAILANQVRGSGEDAELARLVAGLRGAMLDHEPPRPSAELAAYLDAASVRPAAPEPAPRRRSRGRQLVGWVVGLGLGWQLGVGATAALAAVTGAGIAGVLPDPVQVIFDRTIGTVAPEGRDAESPEGTPPTGVHSPARDGSSTAGEPRRDSIAAKRSPGRADSASLRSDGARKTTDEDDPEREDDTSGQGHDTGAPTGAAPPGEQQQGPGAQQPGTGSPDDAEDAAEETSDDDRDAAEEAADEARDAAEEAADEAADRAEEEADEAADRAEDEREKDD